MNALRLRQARNLLATLLLSTGVPMLSMGDEVRRTQLGNNNAYCQDGALSQMPWELDDDAVALRDLVARLVRLRTAHPVLRQRAFFSGRPITPDGVVKDLTWFGVDGRELDDAAWFDPTVATLGMYLDGGSIRTRGPRGERVVDDSFLLLRHTGDRDLDVMLPGEPWGTSYEVVVDTALEHAKGARVTGPLPVCARSVVLLRAHRG